MNELETKILELIKKKPRFFNALSRKLTKLGYERKAVYVALRRLEKIHKKVVSEMITYKKGECWVRQYSLKKQESEKGK